MEGENTKGVHDKKKLENTERWEDKAGNT